VKLQRDSQFLCQRVHQSNYPIVHQSTCQLANLLTNQTHQKQELVDSHRENHVLGEAFYEQLEVQPDQVNEVILKHKVPEKNQRNPAQDSEDSVEPSIFPGRKSDDAEYLEVEPEEVDRVVEVKEARGEIFDHFYRIFCNLLKN
jgi:hypothetical protein